MLALHNECDYRELKHGTDNFMKINDGLLR